MISRLQSHRETLNFAEKAIFLPVIPAQAGIQKMLGVSGNFLDSRLRENDEKNFGKIEIPK